MYLIESIESKDENCYNRWHNRCCGKRCAVDRMLPGYSMIARVEGLILSGSWTDFHTSKIVEIVEKNDVLLVETQNSRYVLRRLPDDRVR
jgi:hypothetical protein